jgi:starvation-inducible outer membrane lipoprotein
LLTKLSTEIWITPKNPQKSTTCGARIHVNPHSHLEEILQKQGIWRLTVVLHPTYAQKWDSGAPQKWVTERMQKSKKNNNISLFYLDIFHSTTAST